MGGHGGLVLRAVVSASVWRCKQVFPGRPEQVGRVRALLRAGLEGCPVIDEVVLLASEIAANAVTHSCSGRPGGEFTVRAAVHEGEYAWVEIEDEGGPWDLKPAHHDGRPHGLDIVSLAASEWRRDGDPDGGWRVWFRIDWPARLECAGDRDG